MNMLVVRLAGRYIISAIAYPFSNLCASKYLKKNLNAKFGGEFAKRVDHMAALLKTLSAQGARMTPDMLPHNSSVGPGSFAESENADNSNMFALFRMNSPMDLYHLLAGNIELVELYLTVNKQIIDEANPR